MIEKEKILSYFGKEDDSYSIKCNTIEEGLSLCEWLELNGVTAFDGSSYQYDSEVLDITTDENEYPILFCTDGYMYNTNFDLSTVINYSELFGNKLAVELL